MPALELNFSKSNFEPICRKCFCYNLNHPVLAPSLHVYSQAGSMQHTKCCSWEAGVVHSAVSWWASNGRKQFKIHHLPPGLAGKTSPATASLFCRRNILSIVSSDFISSLFSPILIFYSWECGVVHSAESWCASKRNLAVFLSHLCKRRCAKTQNSRAQETVCQDLGKG